MEEDARQESEWIDDTTTNDNQAESSSYWIKIRLYRVVVPPQLANSTLPLQLRSVLTVSGEEERTYERLCKCGSAVDSEDHSLDVFRTVFEGALPASSPLQLEVFCSNLTVENEESIHFTELEPPESLASEAIVELDDGPLTLLYSVEPIQPEGELTPKEAAYRSSVGQLTNVSGSFSPNQFEEDWRAIQQQSIPDHQVFDPGMPADDGEEKVHFITHDGAHGIEIHAATEDQQPVCQVGPVIEVFGQEDEFKPGILQCQFDRSELERVLPETMMLLRRSQDGAQYHAVKEAGTATDFSYGYGLISEPGVYVFIAWPSHPIRRKVWSMALQILPEHGTPQQPEEFLQTLRDLVHRNGGFTDLESGNEMSEYDPTVYGEAPTNEKGKPFGPRPVLEPHFPEDINLDQAIDELFDGWLQFDFLFEFKKLAAGPGTTVKSGILNSATKWINWGPANWGGRVRQIVFHPKNARIVYAANARGGVYKSVDGGHNWKALMYRESSLTIGSIALDPKDPSIIYAGIGEFSDTLKSGIPGILKLVDKGANPKWKHFTHLNDRVSKILVSPLDSKLLWVAGESGVECSIDGGTNWFMIMTGTVSDIAFDQVNPKVLYVGFHDNKKTKKGVWRIKDSTIKVIANLKKSNNLENITHNLVLGNTSRPLTFRNDLIKLVTYKDALGKNVLMCQRNYYKLSGIRRQSGIRVSRYIPGQKKWLEIKLLWPVNVQYNYNSILSVNPSDPNIIYASGSWGHWSADGGQTWFRWETGHADDHTLAFDPGNPMRVLAGNDGGIYEYVHKLDADGKVVPGDVLFKDFTSRNNGHHTIEFVAGSVSNWGIYGFAGSTQDQGVLFNHRGKNWDKLWGAEWGDIKLHPQDGKTVIWCPKGNNTNYSSDARDRKKSKTIMRGLHNRKSNRLAFHPTDPSRALSATTGPILGRGKVALPPALLNGLRDFALSIWIKTDNGKEFSILSGANARQFNELLLHYEGKGKISTYIKGKSYTYSCPKPNDNTWHHLFWMRKGTSEYLYMDGKPLGFALGTSRYYTVNSGALKIESGGLWLGQDQDALGGKFEADKAFYGLLSEFKAYNKALTAAQIQKLWKHQPFTNSHLQGQYQFRSNCNDSSPKGHHGIPQHVQFGSKTAPPKAGMGVLEFPKGSGRIWLPHTLLNGLTDFTISIWIKTDNANGFAILSAANTTQDNECLLYYKSNRKIQTFLKTKTRDKQYAGATLCDGKWHHLVWMRSGAHEYLCVDGQTLSKAIGVTTGSTVTSAALLVEANGLWIGQEQDRLGGKFDDKQAFYGEMSEFRVYKRALSSAEVQQLYNNQQPPTLGLMGAYQFFNNCDDSSALAHHGQPGNLYFDTKTSAPRAGMGVVAFPSKNTIHAIHNAASSAAEWKRVLNVNAFPDKMVFAPSNPQIVYATLKSGFIMRSDNGGETWAMVGEGPVSQYSGEYWNLTVDWKNPERIYVVYRQKGVKKNVWRNDTGGKGTWFDLSLGFASPFSMGKRIGPMPDVPIRNLVIDYHNPSILYVGTHAGVMRSYNGGLTWHDFGEGLPKVRINGLFYRPKTRRIFVITYGRGAYYRNV